jgi:hypothetical protein
MLDAVIVKEAAVVEGKSEGDEAISLIVRKFPVLKPASDEIEILSILFVEESVGAG